MKRALQVALLVCIAILLVAAVLDILFGRPGLFPFLPLAGGLVGYWYLFHAKTIEVHCPNCQALQPFWRKPASVRQGLFGGFTCAACGTEMDRHGKATGVKA